MNCNCKGKYHTKECKYKGITVTKEILLEDLKAVIGWIECDRFVCADIDLGVAQRNLKEYIEINEDK